MQNQMMMSGGLGVLKTGLASLEIGQAETYINDSWATSDIQECCNTELPEKRFFVAPKAIVGGCTNRLIVRIE